METKENALKETLVSDFQKEKISRKEAIKKTGYMAASAATMMILLNKNAKAAPATSGNNGWGNGHQNSPGNSEDHNNAENNNSGKPNPTNKK